MGSIHGLRRSLGEGSGNLLQYAYLGNLMDRGAWLATVHGVTKVSDSTWRLNNDKRTFHTDLSKNLFKCKTPSPGTSFSDVAGLTSVNLDLVVGLSSKVHVYYLVTGAMMLPKPGIYFFPWEVSAGQVPDGDTLRTFGR